VSDLFLVHTLEQIKTLANQIEAVFKAQISKSKLVTEEYERQEASLQDIVAAQQ